MHWLAFTLRFCEHFLALGECLCFCGSLFSHLNGEVGHSIQVLPDFWLYKHSFLEERAPTHSSKWPLFVLLSYFPLLSLWLIEAYLPKLLGSNKKWRLPVFPKGHLLEPGMGVEGLQLVRLLWGKIFQISFISPLNMIVLENRRLAVIYFF